MPSFAEYETALRSVGAEPVIYPLFRENGFAMTGDIVDAITPETDALLLCTPNNPTGRSVEKGLLLITAGGNVLRIVPPLVIERAHIDEMIQIMTNVLDGRKG